MLFDLIGGDGGNPGACSVCCWAVTIKVPPSIALASGEEALLEVVLLEVSAAQALPESSEALSPSSIKIAKVNRE